MVWKTDFAPEAAWFEGLALGLQLDPLVNDDDER